MAQLYREFLHSKDIPFSDFEEDFKRSFPKGEISSVVEDVPGHPQSRFINVFIPSEQRNEVVPWWKDYLAFHRLEPCYISRVTHPKVG